MAADREQFANDAQGELRDALSATQTTLAIRDASRFPSLARFRIRVDDELMIVTDGAGTRTWTVVRAAEGTRATTHAAGSEVVHIVTAGALDTLRNPFVTASELGATGDGRTDDHAALTRALEAAAGNKLVLGAGRYRFERTLAIPDRTHVELLPGASLECHVRDGGDGIALGNGSKLSSACGGADGAKIIAADGCSIGSLVTNANHDGKQEFVYIAGIYAIAHSGARVARALVELVSVFVNSGIRDCVLAGNDTAPTGLRIAGGASNGFGPVYVENVWVLSCREHNIVITEHDPQRGTSSCWLTNVTSEHQGAGHHGLYLKGYGGLNNVRVRNFHYEHGKPADQPCAAIYVDGVPGFSLDGADIICAPIANKKGIEITKSYLNCKVRIAGVININAIEPILEDHQTGTTLRARNIGVYESADPGASTGRTDQVFAHLVQMPGGVAIKTKAGAISDADFPEGAPVPDGTLAVDTSNSKLFVRVHGVWKSVSLK